MVRELRPLTLGKLLDEAFNIYRGNFILFLSISALPNIVLLLVQLAGLQLPAGRRDAYGPVIGLGTYLVALFVESITTAAATLAVSDIFLEHPPDLWSCFSRLNGKALRIVAVAFLVQLLVGLGTMMCIIPGIYAAGANGLAIPVAVLENRTAGQALARSRYLATDSVGRVIIVYFLTTIFTGIMVAALNAAARLGGLTSPPGRGVLTEDVLTQITTISGSILFGPISAISLTLEYYDQRIRKEAFDLEHMMQAMRFEPPPAATEMPIS